MSATLSIQRRGTRPNRAINPARGIRNGKDINTAKVAASPHIIIFSFFISMRFVFTRKDIKIITTFV